MTPTIPNDTPLFGQVAELIELARRQVVTTVNLTMVHTYYEIGKAISKTSNRAKPAPNTVTLLSTND